MVPFPAPQFLLLICALVFLLLHTVREKWPLWPAVLCLILLHLIGAR